MVELSWIKTAGPSKRGAIPGKFFHFIGDQALAIAVYLDVHARNTDGLWPQIDDAARTKVTSGGAFSQALLPAFDDGTLVAACNGGRILVFDLAAKAWRHRADPDPIFETKHQLAAYDPERGLLVTWGSHTSKGRKDDTLVHDGTAWRAGKKAAGKWADLGTGSSNFCMYWDPVERAVVRVGVTEVGVFDGAKWTQFPLVGGEALDDWDRIPVVDVGARTALIVQRFGSRQDVIRVVRDGARFVATRVATFPSAVERKASNRAFDACAYHAPSRSLHAYDLQNGDRYVTSLESLLA